MENDTDTTKTSESVGKRLRAMRESLGLSQAKIAEMAKTNQTSVNRFEYGKTEAPFRVLLWYAEYFDVSLDYIFCRTDNPEGALFKNQPTLLKKKIDNTDDFKTFIEACFDPRSPMHEKLKEMMVKLAEGGTGDA